MSQLDISIFYSHLLSLLITFYIFAHFAVMILSVYYYNFKLRNIDNQKELSSFSKDNKLNTLIKIFE